MQWLFYLFFLSVGVHMKKPPNLRKTLDVLFIQKNVNNNSMQMDEWTAQKIDFKIFFCWNATVWNQNSVCFLSCHFPTWWSILVIILFLIRTDINSEKLYLTENLLHNFYYLLYSYPTNSFCKLTSANIFARNH